MILVTGATGLSGSAVVREFARQGVPVRALYRDERKVQALAGLPHVELVKGDMLHPQTLGAAFAHVRRVLMISSARDRMVETQCTFIDAAKQAGVEHIVKFSGRESGDGFDPSAFRGTRMHEEIERYLEAAGVAWTHLRPSQFMQLYLPGALTGVDPVDRSLTVPLGESKLAPIDVADIAKIAVAVMRSDEVAGRRMDMTGPEALTMAQVVARISAITGETFRYKDITPEEEYDALVAAGYPRSVADLLDELFRERRKRRESTCILGAHEEFGVTPTLFGEFAQRHVTQFLGQG